MPTRTELSADDAFDIADQLAMVSAQVLMYRVEHKDTLNDAERESLHKLEDELDDSVTILRNHGVTLVGAKAAKAVEDLNEAIAKAQEALKKIEKAKRAIQLAAAVLDLARTVSTGNVPDILAAAKAVKETAGEA